MSTKALSKSNKNSLIELMRFLFALWVLYYHSYVPYRTGGWSDGYLAVEFFFVLTGFYLVRSIDKYRDLPLKQGLSQFLKHRFLPIATPFLINEVFVLYYSFVINPSPINFFFGFLWYIRDLFIAISLIFIIRKRVKSNKNFHLIIAALSIFSFSIFSWIPIIAWPGGPLRSTAAIPIGMLAAIIPKLVPSKKDKKGIISGIIVALGLVTASLVCLVIAESDTKTQLIRYILVVVVYPAMLYFASCVRFNNGFFNWLGAISFPIYAFQCPLRLLEHYGMNNDTHLFIILMVMVLTYSAITKIVKCKRNKKIIT